MKTITWVFLMLFCIANIKAQNRLEEAANFAADYICNCVNKVYSGVEPDIRDHIINIYYLPANKQTAYLVDLEENVQMKIIEQSMLMADEAKAAEMDDCNNTMVREIEKKYKDIDETAFSEEKMLADMVDRLKSKKKCEFAYMLMNIGLEMQNTEEELNEDKSEGGE
jgi:hypothetical protein